MPGKKVKWSDVAEQGYINAINYIANDSVQSAANFQDKLYKKLLTVAEFPLSCPPDKDKYNNNGNVRAFILFHYKVSYRILDADTIRILRFRHSKMKVKRY